MSDQTVITEDKDKKTEEEKKVPQVIQDRHKTFSQILAEQQQTKTAGNDTQDIIAETSIDKPVSDKKAEDKSATEIEAKKLEEEKQQIQIDAKKHDEELAAKAAEEVVKKQQQEKEAKEKETQALEEEKKRQEALKPKWQTDPDAPKDDKGNPLPKSYDELAQEAARIGKEQAKEEIRAEIAEKEARVKELADQEAKIQADKDAASKQFNETLQNEMNADLDAIYKANDLPKIKTEIKDVSDPTDPGYKDPGYLERENLFKTAVSVNAKRMANGQPLIRSIQVIRYAKDEAGKPYYTPLNTKPAGHDAPVMGSESPVSSESETDKYVIARDRKKPMEQIIREELKKQAAKFRVRN